MCNKLTLHATHLLKLLDKMYKYEMDPTKTVGATEWTRDAGRTDGVKPIYPPPPPTTSLCGGYNELTHWADPPGVAAEVAVVTSELCPVCVVDGVGLVEVLPHLTVAVELCLTHLTGVHGLTCMCRQMDLELEEASKRLATFSARVLLFGMPLGNMRSETKQQDLVCDWQDWLFLPWSSKTINRYIFMVFFPQTSPIYLLPNVIHDPCGIWGVLGKKKPRKYQWPLLLTWFNFNPSMDK